MDSRTLFRSGRTSRNGMNRIRVRRICGECQRQAETGLRWCRLCRHAFRGRAEP